MKLLFKYSLLTLVVFCFNSGLTETLNMCHEPSSHTETRFIAHTQSARLAVSNFYDHCPHMACDVVHHSQDVPVVKYILRAVHFYSKSNLAPDVPKKKHTGLFPLYSCNPISYYVFGLRKIVI